MTEPEPVLAIVTALAVLVVLVELVIVLRTMRHVLVELTALRGVVSARLLALPRPIEPEPDPIESTPATPPVGHDFRPDATNRGKSSDDAPTF